MLVGTGSDGMSVVTDGVGSTEEFDLQKCCVQASERESMHTRL